MLASSIPFLLGLVMLTMGMTLGGRDFLPLLKRPWDVAIGVAAQFLVMPLVAWLVVKALGLPAELALGVVLVGACPGGTASNVMTYLAKGDVPLSVAMTSVSTLMAPFVTPFWVWALADRVIAVDAPAMCLSVLEVVILPIALGVVLNSCWPRFCERLKPVLPKLSLGVILLIVYVVVSGNWSAICSSAGLLLAAVVLHNGLGMAVGYAIGRLCRLSAAKCRTLAIEVGMQNSGLAVSLASVHFASLALASVPGAVFSVWHNLSGFGLVFGLRTFGRRIQRHHEQHQRE